MVIIFKEDWCKELSFTMQIMNMNQSTKYMRDTWLREERAVIQTNLLPVCFTAYSQVITTLKAFFLRMQSWIVHANIKLPCHLVPLWELIGHCVIMPGLLHRVESFDFWILSFIGCFLFGLIACLFFKYRLRAWFLFWFHFSSSQLCLSIFEKVIYSGL